MMKATGMVRRIDDLGRVVIPKELRTTFGINEGDPLEIFVDDNLIILKKYAPGCALCGRAGDHQIVVENGLVCKQCVRAIALLTEAGR